MTKRRVNVKKGCPALHTNKNFIRSWFVVCKLGCFRKKMEVEDMLFWKHHWNFWVCYFTLGNTGHNKASSLEIHQNWVTPLGNSENKKPKPLQILCDFFLFFFLLLLKIWLVSYLTPGNFTCYFFNIPGKSMFWDFLTFTWTGKLLIIRY